MFKTYFMETELITHAAPFLGLCWSLELQANVATVPGRSILCAVRVDEGDEDKLLALRTEMKRQCIDEPLKLEIPF